MDKLVVALTARRAAYEEISGKFGLLRHLTTAPPEEIDSLAKALVDTYPADIQPTLSSELYFLASLLRPSLSSLSSSCFCG